MNGMLGVLIGTSLRAKRFHGKGNPFNTSREVTAMTRTLTALAAAASMAVATIAVPQPAQARWGGHGGWHGGGGAFIGGLAAGAIVGGALAAPYYYGDGPYYGGYGYYGGPYAYGAYGACYRERVATPYGWRWQRVCE
jgi:hypothetical protein